MTAPWRVCLVGAGPRGTGVLERLIALAPSMLAGAALEVHVVDPYPPGPGRIWRRAQSDLLWMNSPAGTVDQFTDGHDGDLPSLWEWVRDIGRKQLAGGRLAEEAHRLHERGFASRPLAGEYYSWVFDRLIHRTGSDVRVIVHRDRAVDVRDASDSISQEVWLAEADSPLLVDSVVLTLGHLDPGDDNGDLEHRAFAQLHGLVYLPPGEASTVDLTEVPGGENVILSGIGLTFIDYMVLLTQGRGGRFHREEGGALVYSPSGREPILCVGSRRGVPYHAKPAYRLRGKRPPLPLFFHEDAVRSLLDEYGTLDFRRHLWPLVRKEIAAAYYHELFTTRPESTRLSWEEFSARLVEEDIDELAALAVPSPDDRFALDRLVRPFGDVRFSSAEHLQRWMRSYVQTDLRRRTDPRYSAESGALAGLGSAVMTTLQLAEEGALSAVSRARDVEGWLLPWTSFLSSGPPAIRLEEMLALSEAGVLRFVGPEMKIDRDRDVGRFVAKSSRVPGSVVASRCLIEARLAEVGVSDTADPLMRAMFARGDCVEQELRDAIDGFTHRTGRLCVRQGDHRLVLASGEVHPRRFALGPCVAQVRTAGTDSYGKLELGFFTQNNQVAEAVLKEAGRAKHTTGTVLTAAWSGNDVSRV